MYECICVCGRGGEVRGKEAGLGRERIWTVMIYTGFNPTHREIWSWDSLQNCPTVGLLYPPITAWMPSATGKGCDLEKFSWRARAKRQRLS